MLLRPVYEQNKEPNHYNRQKGKVYGSLVWLSCYETKARFGERFTEMKSLIISV